MATTSNEAKKDDQAFYGYLFTKSKPIPTPTPVFDALLRAIALHITNELGDKSDSHLTPAKLAAFYQTAGDAWDSFFVDMPHAAISTVYQGLGCQHALLPGTDDYAAPSIPALTTKGFVRWQTIQTLLGPQTQVPVLQFAAANWALKHPDTGASLPVSLPVEAFPADTDADTDRWHQERAHRSRLKAAAEEQEEVPKETPKPDFTDRKVPFSHVRINPTAPRDYFAPRPVNVTYVHVPSPRVTPSGRSPERDRAREREHFVRRQTSSTEEAAQRRRSFSDYPHSPQEARPVRIPRIVPERDQRRRRHSQPRHYSSTSDSEEPPISPRTAPRRTGRSNEPPPISIRRVYTGSSEDSPRVIRTTMAPPPIPPSHMHSPRPSDGGRIPSHDDSKRRSTLFDIKEKITNFINPADRARSVSGTRGRREGPAGPARGSRDEILPNSRLSRSWSEIDTDDTDVEEARRKRNRRPSHEPKEYHRRDKERDRDRDRDRERDRAARDQDRERDRERGRDRPPLRERDRAHSDSDRHRHERRDRNADRLTPPTTAAAAAPSTAIPSPAASAATAALSRDNTAPLPSTATATAARRRGNSDNDHLSPTRAHRGPYLAEGGHHHRRTSSHADLDRLDGARRRPGEWERERDRDRDLLMRERERERMRRDSRERERDRDRDRERFREEGGGGGGGSGERWRREAGERLPRERERDRDRDRDRELRDRDRDRDRERERMPSPAMSGSGVTGVSGRKYPETMPWEH